MDSKFSKAIDAALNAKEVRELEAAQRAQNAKHKADVERTEFWRIREEIIRPAMLEIVEYLKTKNIASQITVEDSTTHPQGMGRDMIQISLGPSRYSTYGNPNFAAILVPGSGIVRFHENATSEGHGGTSGPAGEAALSAITADQIQGAIANLIQKVFG